MVVRHLHCYDSIVVRRRFLSWQSQRLPVERVEVWIIYDLAWDWVLVPCRRRRCRRHYDDDNDDDSYPS